MSESDARFSKKDNTKIDIQRNMSKKSIEIKNRHHNFRTIDEFENNKDLQMIKRCHSRNKSTKSAQSESISNDDIEKEGLPKITESNMSLPKVKREDSFDPYNNIGVSKNRVFRKNEIHLRKNSLPVKIKAKMFTPDQIPSLEHSFYKPVR